MNMEIKVKCEVPDDYSEQQPVSTVGSEHGCESQKCHVKCEPVEGNNGDPSKASTLCHEIQPRCSHPLIKDEPLDCTNVKMIFAATPRSTTAAISISDDKVACIDHRQPSLLVIGHSFISRLDNYLHRSSSLSSVAGHVVRFVGVPGADIHRLRQKAESTDFRGVRAVHIEVGSNDLSTRCSVTTFVNDIKSFIEWLLQRGVPQVVVGEILYRTDAASVMDVPLTVFNAKVAAANRQLSDAFKQSLNVDFRRHVRARNEVSQDGVHPTDVGLRMLWQSIRSGLVRSFHRS